MPVTRQQIRGMYKPFLVEAIRLENEVQALLDEWEAENEKIVFKNSTSSGIKSQQELLRELLVAVTYFLSQYGIVMNTGIGRISDTKVKQCLEESLPLLRAVQDTEDIRLFKNGLDKFNTDYKTKWQKIAIGIYGLTFLDRQKGVAVSTEKTIKNIVNLGTQQGFSSKQMIEVLKDYVNPNTSAAKPFDIARKALGASKDFRPKDVLAGSVQTNLYEITRNEASELWRDMTEDAYRDAEWVKGYRWELSGSHPAPDICDDLAEHGVYDKDEERPYSHGHCLCDWVPELLSVNEMRELLESKASLYNSK